MDIVRKTYATIVRAWRWNQWLPLVRLVTHLSSFTFDLSGALIAVSSISYAASLHANPVQNHASLFANASAEPFRDSRVHRVGGMRLTATNWGTFTGAIDPCTGLPAPALESPPASNLQYLSAAALWVGAVRDQDTFVSVGWDGWQFAYEFMPSAYPDGRIQERTTRPILAAPPNSSCPDIYFSTDAVSEQDIIATYSDTVTDPSFVQSGPFETRVHQPLGIGVTQRSFAWSFSYAQSFTLVDYQITNVRRDMLQGVYIGLYVDFDVGSLYKRGFSSDDISGFLRTMPAIVGGGFLDTVDVAWIADNDGDPILGRFSPTYVTGAAGVRVLEPPDPGMRTSFNWWISNYDASLDWGPNGRSSRVQFIAGNLGTPEGDRAKYQIMSNGEFDYDQIETPLNHEAEGWLPPPRDPTLANDIADGFDTRFLLSFGPFQLPPDTALSFAVAFLVADDFHANPSNFAFFDPQEPSAYAANLNLEKLGALARWASWVYDAPGLDTDHDGYKGRYRVVGQDTVYYAGDGVPDFITPPPPTVPPVQITTEVGRITMRWNGFHAERDLDPFSYRADFEGYNIHMSRSGRADDFALVAQRDRVDYTRRCWDRGTDRWQVSGPPLTLDSLKFMYDSLSRAIHGYPFHPDSFAVPDIKRAMLQVVLDEKDPSRLDSNYYYFTRYEANVSANDAAYVATAEAGYDVTGVIRKLCPDASSEEIRYRKDGSPYHPYYEYEYILKDLNVAEPVFVALTTFDFGHVEMAVLPIESSPTANSYDVWPVNSAKVVKTERPKPGVYPNPYRFADAYNALGWENPRGLEPDPERARKITFFNVPDTCVVSIWSIDGDLVRRLEHRENPSSSDASVVIWNLITRNTQAVKTGIYLYSIESRFGVDTGKLVIIK
jgi:hypothetical protein